MNLLLATESFVVRESLENLFCNMLWDPQILSISDLTKIDLEEISDLDFIFVDIKEGWESHIKVINEAKILFPNVKVMILGRNNDKTLFEKVVELGIEGYIKGFSEKEEFIFILKKVLQGQKVYESDLVQSLLYDNRKKNINGLTKREIEVLLELGKGLNNKQISQNLFITEHTVKKHISNILDKLSLNNRQEAIIYLINNPL